MLGTLLGLLLNQGLSTTSTTAVTGNGTSVTVNVNSTSSSTSTSSGGSGTNTTTSVLPIFVYTNGTLAGFGFPFFGFNGLNGFNNGFNIGLGGLLGIGQLGGFFFGRSFTNPYYSLLQYLLDILLSLIEYIQDEGDYVFMEADY